MMVATATKIVFVTFVGKAENFEHRFFVRELMEQGLNIELWDLSCLFGKARDVDNRPDPLYVKKYWLRADVEAAIESNRAVTFVMLFGVEYRFLWLYRLLTRWRCTLYFFSWGVFPFYRLRNSTTAASAIPDLGRLYRGLVLRLHRALGFVKTFDVVLYAGARAKDFVPGARHYIPLNHPDVEEYYDLQSAIAQQNETLRSQRYAVFLDCYLPFHPDFRINNMTAIDSQKYRLAINHFFSRIEHELGMPVVIAAHPKAAYPLQYFESRAVIANQTAQLVMGSSLVISHYSTSTSYAVLWKKSIVFIYSDEMEAHQGARHMVPITAALAVALSMPLYNIDHLPETLSTANSEDALYEKYKMNYLTTLSSSASRNKNIIFKAFTAPPVDEQL